ncbi:MAG TPA: type II toxin-antitoxin system RelE/ParE family toxin [Thermomicrobiales bacterium]|nr:type II toxin-antitoxin system RelE/ParE family toxin [Thermomicrobiales bacterium]
MDFRITFYSDEDDEPFQEFVRQLQDSHPEVLQLVVSGLERLRDRRRHGPPLTELVDPAHDIFELRVGRANIARVFFFFEPDWNIIVTHGSVKKRQKLDVSELNRARRYKRIWEERRR